MATNESYKDKDGKQVNKATWHRIVVFGKVAETCATYLAKGRQVLVEGKIQNRSWVDKEGKTRYVSEVVASSVKFLGGTPKGKPKAGEEDIPLLSEEDAAEPISASDVTF
jgi:single-strand DNA-binding protein